MTEQKELIASKLKRIYHHHENFQTALVALREFLGELNQLKVLEAGCGSASHIHMSDCSVTGIDISPYQLERNQRLTERICADLHQYDNPAWAQSFDVIICWDVLEHLQNPKIVVEKFFKWLKPGGKIVLGYPNPQIWKGVVTKYSPYFVHQLFYRIASGTPFSASKTDQGPFQTVFAKEIQLYALMSSAFSNGYEPTFFATYESYQNRFVKRYLPHFVVDALNRFFLGELKTLLDVSATDFVIVLSRHTPTDTLTATTLEAQDKAATRA